MNGKAHIFWERYYHLGGKLQRFIRFVALAWRWWLISVVVFAVGLVVDFCLNPRISVTKVLIGLTLLGEIAALLREYLEKRHALSQLEFCNVDPRELARLSFRLNESYRSSCYDILDCHGLYVLYSPAINRQLPANSLSFKKKGQFRKSSIFLTIAPAALFKSLQESSIVFKEAKVRLCTDLTNETFEHGIVYLQKTDYLASSCTNEITLAKVVSKELGCEIFNGVRNIGRITNDSAQPACHVFTLQESPCSNHIGISTLAITKDGRIILTKQSPKNAQSPGLLAPSGSGSANWSDLKHTKGILNSFLQNAMVRELREELGFKHFTHQQVRTIIVGFARILNRGGKPEFFGVTFLDTPAPLGKVSARERVFTEGIEEINIPITEKDWQALATGDPRIDEELKQEITQVIDTFIAKNRVRLSPSLYLNLRFFKEWLRRPGHTADGPPENPEECRSLYRTRFREEKPCND
jgi:hypothetical protein